MLFNEPIVSLCAKVLPKSLRPKRPNIVYLIKVRAVGDGWAQGQGAVAQISVHLHKDNQAPRPTANHIVNNKGQDPRVTTP